MEARGHTENDWAEIKRLRDWRHDVVTPTLAALREQVKMNTERLAATEAKVERMARADEIAAAVQDRAQSSRRGLLNAWQRALGGVAVLAAVASVILQVVYHHT